MLELSIVGSFSRLGPPVRGRLFGWTAPQPGALVGRTVVLTGPTSGLGRETAGALAALGARVILVGRNEERLARSATNSWRMHGEDAIPIVVADMASLASVRAAAARSWTPEPRLDTVVDNAGRDLPGADREPRRDRGDARRARRRAVRHDRGPAPLRRSESAAGGSVTSGGMYTQAVARRPHGSGGLSGPRAYARAKRAQVSLAREWAGRLAGTGVTVNAMHPGWVDTPGLAQSLPGFYRLMRPLLRSAAQGMDTIVWLAAAPGCGGPASESCSSTAGPGRSIGSHRRACPPPTAGVSGT